MKELYRRSIKRRLEKVVRGEVKVYWEGNNLTVEIKSLIIYKGSIELEGEYYRLYSTQEIAEEIIEGYAIAIINKLFKVRS